MQAGTDNWDWLALLPAATTVATPLRHKVSTAAARMDSLQLNEVVSLARLKFTATMGSPTALVVAN